MNHREKCNQLKEIRKNMADQLGIDLHQTVCTYEGECKGTCPKCAAEEKKLNKALLAGKVALAGLAISTMTLTGCGVTEELSDNPGDEQRARTKEREKDRDKNNKNNEKENKEPEITIEGDVVDDYYNYDGGLEYYDPDDIAGELAFYYDTDYILQCCGNYAPADFVELDCDNQCADGSVIIRCYNIDGDGNTEIINIITVDDYSGDAVDMNGNEFHIDDYYN